jgi:hypothetical protein
MGFNAIPPIFYSIVTNFKHFSYALADRRVRFVPTSAFTTASFAFTITTSAFTTATSASTCIAALVFCDFGDANKAASLIVERVFGDIGGDAVSELLSSFSPLPPPSCSPPC